MPQNPKVDLRDLGNAIPTFLYFDSESVGSSVPAVPANAGIVPDSQILPTRADRHHAGRRLGEVS
jgi:hypothetical protein